MKETHPSDSKQLKLGFCQKKDRTTVSFNFFELRPACFAFRVWQSSIQILGHVNRGRRNPSEGGVQRNEMRCGALSALKYFDI